MSSQAFLDELARRAVSAASEGVESAVEARIDAATEKARARMQRALEEDEGDDVATNVAKSQIKGLMSRNINEREFSDIGESERTSARITKASYINLTEGEHAAQAYLNEHEPNWVIDHSLTTEHAMVCVNPETKEIRMGMRGTQNFGEISVAPNDVQKALKTPSFRCNLQAANMKFRNLADENVMDFY